MIRILHILHSMNRGGVESMLMNYYRSIDRTQVQFDFLLTEQNKCLFEDEIEELGGRVFRVPLPRIITPLPYINGLRLFFVEHPEYTIVHSHTSSKSAIPLWVAKKSGVPVRIAHSHNNKSEAGIYGKVRDLLKIPLRSVATDFFACGEEAAKWLFGQKIWKMGSVSVLANAIPVEKYVFNFKQRDMIRNKYKIPSNTLVLGMVARFSVQKNHVFALELIRALRNRGEDVRLLLVGDGELKNTILRKVADYRIGKEVLLTGVVSDISVQLQAMDAVLMPSFSEGLPVSLIEAQANGLQCVVSDRVPAEVDITGNVTFLPLNIKMWTDFISTMTEKKKGVERDVKAIGKVRAAGYDIENASKLLERWYVNKSQMGTKIIKS